MVSSSDHCFIAVADDRLCHLPTAPKTEMSVKGDIVSTGVSRQNVRRLEAYNEEMAQETPSRASTKGPGRRDLAVEWRQVAAGDHRGAKESHQMFLRQRSPFASEAARN